MKTTPTTEDRIWAVLSHLSALAFGMGIALPIVGWSDQRRKSSYASFQSLQALGYQSLGFTVWVLSYLVLVILGAILLLFSSGFSREPGSTQEVMLQPGVILFLSITLGLFALYFVLPIIAAVACALGRDFRYPILGDRLASYLKYDTGPAEQDSVLDEDRELRWVAAMGHFSILIFLWGMLAPLTAWILQGKRSPLLRFQSIQTLIYQAFATLIYFVALFLYLFSLVLLIMGVESIGMQNFDSVPGIIGLVLFVITLLISILLILFVPVLHILGQWAGYRVLKWDPYRYPLIGRLVEQWMATPALRETDTLNLQGKSL